MTAVVVVVVPRSVSASASFIRRRAECSRALQKRNETVRGGGDVKQSKAPGAWCLVQKLSSDPATWKTCQIDIRAHPYKKREKKRRRASK